MNQHRLHWMQMVTKVIIASRGWLCPLPRWNRAQAAQETENRLMEFSNEFRGFLVSFKMFRFVSIVITIQRYVAGSGLSMIIRVRQISYYSLQSFSSFDYNWTSFFFCSDWRCEWIYVTFQSGRCTLFFNCISFALLFRALFSFAYLPPSVRCSFTVLVAVTRCFESIKSPATTGSCDIIFELIAEP